MTTIVALHCVFIFSSLPASPTVGRRIFSARAATTAWKEAHLSLRSHVNE